MSTEFDNIIDKIIFQFRGADNPPAADNTTPIKVRLQTFLKCNTIPELNEIADCLTQLESRLDPTTTDLFALEQMLKINGANYIDLSPDSSASWAAFLVFYAYINNSQGTCEDFAACCYRAGLTLKEYYPAAMELHSSIDLAEISQPILDALRRAKAAGIDVFSIVLDDTRKCKYDVDKYNTKKYQKTLAW